MNFLFILLTINLNAASIDPTPVLNRNDIWFASNTFTVAGNGLTVDVSCTPAKSFAIQVYGSSTPATSWTAVLEASLNTSSFTTVLNHTNILPGDGNTQYSGTTLYPSRYFRCRISALSLGVAQHLVCLVLGIP